jgi:hypothetical protein
MRKSALIVMTAAVLFDLANFGQVVSRQKPVCVSGQCLRSSFGGTRRQYFAKHFCLCSGQG